MIATARIVRRAGRATPRRVVRRRNARRSISIDTECTGTNVWTGARPFAVSVCRDDESTRWFEWTVDPRTRKPNVDPKDVRELQRIVMDRAFRKRFYNAKFDYFMLESIGVEVPMDQVEEVHFMAKAVDNLELSYELKHLTKKHLGMDDSDQKDLHDAVVKSRRLAKKLGYETAEDKEGDYWMPHTLSVLHPAEFRATGIDAKVCKAYGVKDAVRTQRLGDYYEYGMSELGVRPVYEREMELWPETVEMERHGARVDPERMAEKREECVGVINKFQAILNEKAGRRKADPEFNVNAPKQIIKLLFEGDGALPVVKRTKTGQPKTDAEALAPHKADPRVEALFRVRANRKAVNDFFDKYERLATRDGEGQLIVHPGYRQWGTLTGRYSCSDPNLQAVSDPDTSNSLSAEFMVDIRQVFVPRKGCVWYCPDYSQVEVIIFADISGEPTMIEALKGGQDIHGATAEKIWGGEGNPRAMEAALELLGTTDRGRARALMQEHGWSIGAAEKSLEKKTFRKKAKSVTFTKIFGGGPLALMRWIGVDKTTAKRILNAYDESFPTMVACVAEIEKRGKTDGYVVNKFGRRLAVDPWFAYRAVNHMVQSSAADLMKLGMRKTARYLRETGLDARILLTVHDELIFEFRKGHAFKHVIREVCRLMADHEGAFSIATPVDVEKVTERWSDKSKVQLELAA